MQLRAASGLLPFPARFSPGDEEALIRPAGPIRFLADGSATPCLVDLRFGMEPSGEYVSTLSGFLRNALGRSSVPGDAGEILGMHFTVLSLANRHSEVSEIKLPVGTAG